MLRPEYEQGKPCGNCILLKGAINQPEWEEKLEKTLRNNAEKFLPGHLLPEVRIVRYEEAKKYWPGLPTRAMGWVYEPKEEKKPEKKKAQAAI